MSDLYPCQTLLPTQLLYSADYGAEQRYFYQCGRATEQVKND